MPPRDTLGLKGRWMATLALAAMALLIAGVASVPFWLLSIERTVSDNMNDFSALWNTTDALQIYVRNTERWPRDWNTLSTAFAEVDPRYSDGDTSFVRDRVDINFSISLDDLPLANGWYVRLRSGRLKPEQDSANGRLRRLTMRAYQKDVRDLRAEGEVLREDEP